MFLVNNKNFIDVVDVVLMLLLLTLLLTYFTSFFDVSVVDFEQVGVSWLLVLKAYISNHFPNLSIAEQEYSNKSLK